MDRHLDLLSGTVAVGPFNMPRMYDMVIKKSRNIRDTNLKRSQREILIFFHIYRFVCLFDGV